MHYMYNTCTCTGRPGCRVSSYLRHKTEIEILPPFLFLSVQSHIEFQRPLAAAGVSAYSYPHSLHPARVDHLRTENTAQTLLVIYVETTRSECGYFQSLR